MVSAASSRRTRHSSSTRRMVSSSAPRWCLLDLQQRLEQPQPFLVAGVVGIEGAGEIEGAAEAGFPGFLIGAGGVVAAVEQREARPAGPAEDLHLREEIVAQRLRGIDDVEHARSVEQRL